MRILESSHVASKHSGVDSLASIDVHELAGVALAQAHEGLLDLFHFGQADALHLAFANSVAVEDNTARERSVVLFESITGVLHAVLEGVRALLSDFVLDDARRPVGSGRLVHRGGQSQNGLLAEGGGVEHVKAAHHGGFVHKRQVIHRPGNAADLCVHLDQHL